jgi:hypothetical protein
MVILADQIYVCSGDQVLLLYSELFHKVHCDCRAFFPLLSFLEDDLQFKETSEVFYLIDVISGLPN